MSERIETFRDLHVHQSAFRLQQNIYRLTKRFPKEECYSLTDQIRRSSRSIGANISESWQKRRYTNHFISKLTDADGELAETEHWIETSLACKYITSEEHKNLFDQCRYIGKMLGKMIKEPNKWCQRFK